MAGQQEENLSPLIIFNCLTEINTIMSALKKKKLLRIFLQTRIVNNGTKTLLQHNSRILDHDEQRKSQSIAVSLDFNTISMAWVRLLWLSEWTTATTVVSKVYQMVGTQSLEVDLSVSINSRTTLMNGSQLPHLLLMSYLAINVQKNKSSIVSITQGFL